MSKTYVSFINFVNETKAILSNYGTLEDAARAEKCTVGLIKFWHTKIFGVEPDSTPDNCKRIFEIFIKITKMDTQAIKNRLDLDNLIKEGEIIWMYGRPYSRQSMHLTNDLMNEIKGKYPQKVEPNPYKELQAPKVEIKKIEITNSPILKELGEVGYIVNDEKTNMTGKYGLAVNVLNSTCTALLFDSDFYAENHMRISGTIAEKYTTGDVKDVDIVNIEGSGDIKQDAVNLLKNLGATNIFDGQEKPKINFSQMTVRELKKYAKDNGISVNGTKSKMIKDLTKWQNS